MSTTTETSFERRRREREDRRDQRRQRLAEISPASTSLIAAQRLQNHVAVKVDERSPKFGTMHQAKQIYVRSIGIFSDASDEFCAALTEVFTRRAFHAHEVLALDGAPSEAILHITVGEAVVEMGGAAVATLKRGSTVGDKALILGQSCVGTVRATTEGAL
jgi:hypothetical protein